MDRPGVHRPPRAREMGNGKARAAISIVLSLTLVALVTAHAVRPKSVRRLPSSTIGLDTLPDSTWMRLVANGHRVGSVNASVTIVVFTDYECPFCRLAESALAAIRNVFPEDLAVIYRHYPLSSHEPAAYEKARIAECAARAGKFAKLQPILYRVRAGDEPLSESVARAARIGDPAFLACASDTAKVPAIEEDLALILAIGTRRTPSIFINGRLMNDTPDSAQLHQLITQFLSE
jgi:protein-disulfide isomerase